MPSPDAESPVGIQAALAVERLADRLGEVSRTIQRHLLAEIEDLQGDQQLHELLRDSVEGNVDTIFSAIQHAIPIENMEPPTAALEYARRLAQHGIAPNALVRAYRLGQQKLLSIVSEEVRALVLDPQLRLDVFEQITAITFGYIDWISQQVVQTYQIERDHWLENRNSVRAVRVREVLDGHAVDVDAVSEAIRYPLRRTHLALVLWVPGGGDELGRLERFVRELAESMDALGAGLFVAADRLTGWGWIPLASITGADCARQVRRFTATRPDAPWIALGTPLPGVEGFRDSHRQALRARTVALAGGTAAERVTAASDPGLTAAALLGRDLAEAREWVWQVLGPLAVDSDGDARLRETLRVFLLAGSSHKAAAEALNLHANSVKYRVNRAIERRGEPIGDDRLDVEMALLLCHWFGGSVLRPEGR
ncbi:helix-turn-helix domain-containing protein [Nocardia cyriacigeorgica]|uniref:PucR family transcriptional regulator n=1 Tax=Nocardia cyriacigeorgica TaxID=135487 RepID=UPI0018939C96|nr:helix-turn-helix domain-containing protein [Nocardia cyriacigeorgica]MBF6428132.1 helix-turn-helix domain-containing protein [Nocardia cyriacigeorgica]